MWPFKSPKPEFVPAATGREIAERVWRMYGPQIDPSMATSLQVSSPRPRQERVIYGKPDAREAYYVALFAGAYTISGRVQDVVRKSTLLAGYWQAAISDGTSPEDADDELWRKLLEPGTAEYKLHSKVYPEAGRNAATRDAWNLVRTGTAYYANLASSKRARRVANAVDVAYQRKVSAAYPGRGARIFMEVLGVVEKLLAGKASE